MADHPILDHLSRPGARIALAAGLVVLGLGLGGLALSGRVSADAAATRGPGLSIAVVSPPEREVQPGEVMEVGRLTNDFDGTLPAPQDVDAPYDYGVDQPAYVEADWDRDPPRSAWRDDPRMDRPAGPAPYREDRYPDEPQERGRPDAFADNPRAFGFDAPRPDYRAERDVRRAVLEARIEAGRRQARRIEDMRMEDERMDQPRVRRYASSGRDDGPHPYDRNE